MFTSESFSIEFQLIGSQTEDILIFVFQDQLAWGHVSRNLNLVVYVPFKIHLVFVGHFSDLEKHLVVWKSVGARNYFPPQYYIWKDMAFAS